jgi:hypothetical protein
VTSTAPIVDTLEGGRDLLASGVDQGRLAVVATASVPKWLDLLVQEAAAASVTVVVIARRPDGLDGDAIDGWEIGIVTAALAAGAQVEGIAERRVARVASILARWEGR